MWAHALVSSLRPHTLVAGWKDNRRVSVFVVLCKAGRGDLLAGWSGDVRFKDVFADADFVDIRESDTADNMPKPDIYVCM